MISFKNQQYINHIQQRLWQQIYKEQKQNRLINLNQKKHSFLIFLSLFVFFSK
jgi:hypothetical protein